MAETFGLEIKSLLTTQAYSRFFPKRSKRFRLIEDWKEIDRAINNYDLNTKSDITMFDYWKNIIKNNE